MLSPHVGMTRSQVAEHVGVDRQTVRNWEREGLVAPSGRAPSPHDNAALLYHHRDIVRVELVAALRRMNVTSPTIATALAGLDLSGPGNWTGFAVVWADGAALTANYDELTALLDRHDGAFVRPIALRPAATAVAA